VGSPRDVARALLINLDFTVVNLGLADTQRDLDTSRPELQ
jgi:hypothetical protein